MPHFLIVAYDGTDAGALDRRMQARPVHFAALKAEVEAGHILMAGAIMDDRGAMIGSSIVTEFPDRAALDAWLAVEPYINQGVWQKIEITPFRLAVLDGEMMP